MDPAPDGTEAVRQPDGRALKILFDTYWTPSGWRDLADQHTSPDDFSYAAHQGVMFEPRQLTHDAAVEEAMAANASVSPELVASAFVYSLSSRRLDLRSALGSYAATMHLRQHRFARQAASWPACEICGLFQRDMVEPSTFNFERFKWGGVRHLGVDYAAFDLTQLRLWYEAPASAESTLLERLLHGWRALPPVARSRQAADAARGVIESNDAERRTLVGIVSIAGVLQPRALPSMRDEYVPDVDRNAAFPGGRNDWEYPAFSWTGRDGVNEDAVMSWWGRAVAEPRASTAACAPPLRPKPGPPAVRAPGYLRAGPTRAEAGPSAASITYPFVPKSNAFLVPGQFWGIPLSDGRYACGRVLDVDREATYGRRVSFLAGLMDWSGDEPPTAESIAGVRLLTQGDAHIRTITENGRQVLGHRPLDADGLEPLMCLSGQFGGDLQRGLTVLRRATREEEQTLPVLGHWGFKFISHRAEREFVQPPSAATGSPS